MKTYHVNHWDNEDGPDEFEVFECEAENPDDARFQAQEANPDRVIGYPRAVLFSVAVYTVDQAYGGPEEGGWWFTYGELCEPREVEEAPTYHATREQAVNRRAAVQGWLDEHLNKGRRPISSVLSEGQYEAMIHTGHPPQRWPESRPHYE